MKTSPLQRKLCLHTLTRAGPPAAGTGAQLPVAVSPETASGPPGAHVPRAVPSHSDRAGRVTRQDGGGCGE